MAAPPTTGNTVLGPPRLTGDPASDLLALQRFLGSYYDQMQKVFNVTGQLTDHEARITALEQKVTALGP